jgi:hypothetical protein
VSKTANHPDPMLEQYLDALEEHGGEELAIKQEDEQLPPGQEMRTCPSCGDHVAFKLVDPDGTWFECSNCGELA